MEKKREQSALRRFLCHFRPVFGVLKDKQQYRERPKRNEKANGEAPESPGQTPFEQWGSWSRFVSI